MSSEATSDRKRKRRPTAEVLEAAASIDDQRNTKARRVSANASASPTVNLTVKAEAASDSEESESISEDVQEDDESMEIIG